MAGRLRATWRAFRPARAKFPRLPDHAGHYLGWRPGRSPAIDVYVPPGVDHPASVLIVHGGAYVVGSREMPAVLSLVDALVSRGVAVAALDYRTLRHGGRFAEAVSDARAGLRWWHRHAHIHGCDPDRIAVLGISAGAGPALTALQLEEDVAWSAAIGVYGVYDFCNPPPWAGPRGMAILLRSKDPEDWARQSVLNTFHRPIPTLLLHGEDDGMVPIAQSRVLAARRERDGQPVKLITYPGEAHAFLADPDRPAWAAGIRAITEFVADPS